MWPMLYKRLHITQPQQQKTCCSALPKRITARNYFSGFHILLITYTMLHPKKCLAVLKTLNTLLMSYYLYVNDQAAVNICSWG